MRSRNVCAFCFIVEHSLVSLQAIFIHSETRKKIKNRIKSSWSNTHVRLSSKTRAPFGERSSNAARQAIAKLRVAPVGPLGPLGPHYGRYLVVGDITANCHPQKRNGISSPPLLEPRSRPIARCIAYVSQRLGFTTETLLSPFSLPLRRLSPPAFSALTVRLSAACNTVIGQFRGFSSE